MTLTMRKSEWLDDWYVIEKTEHEGVQRIVSDGPGVSHLFCSSRISDADVEGRASEMLALADAIERREIETFKRCAVDARTDRVQLWSPRNSQRPGIVSRADADALAAQIRRDLAKEPETGGVER